MIDYYWVPWFRELATKIAQSDEGYLVEKAKEVEWDRSGKNPVPAILRYGDKNIDPLSFLYFLARDRGTEMLHSELKSVHEVFSIEKKRPKSDPYIPRPSGINTLFHYGGVGRPDLIWRLFRQAEKDIPEIDPEYFNAALDIKGVAIIKLTQTLFLANPNYFLPADHINEVLPCSKFKKKVTNYQEYVDRMEDIKCLFPGCKPYEINVVLDVQSRKEPLISAGSSFFHINSDVKVDGPDHWAKNKSLPPDTLTFKEKNIVYIGPEREDDPRPKAHRGSRNVVEPKRGDIIFVRFGPSDGRGLGVVEENAYNPDGWDPDKGISVHWINKQSGRIGGEGLGRSSFRKLSVTSERYMNVRNAAAYKDTFHLIEQWQKGDEGENEQPPPDIEDESGTKAQAMDEDDKNSLSLNTILFGPPGTGKTYETVSHAVAIIDRKDPAELTKPELRKQVKKRFDELKGQKQIEFVTFHQNYTYEDFIEGIRPELRQSKSTGENQSETANESQNELAYKLHDGIFKKIAQWAEDYSGNRYVLIIDEINRGNIAKIFGELITLIEPSKRLGEGDAARATLPYSGESFGVPNNLHILGTMNTADRSIALLDTALRRRFDFIEMMPNPDLVEDDIEGVNGRQLLKAINSRIKAKLDREHQIGHTYLMGVKTIDALATAFQHRILPLLQEYFYDDWEKICSVLNSGVEDGRKDDSLNPFIRKDSSAPSGEDADRPGFELLPRDDEKWREAESYRQIYTPEGRQEGSDGG